MTRKDKIISLSNLIAQRIGLTLENKEFNYGKGIGRADNYCITSEYIVIFELEFSQRHPEMNVLKVWPYLNNNPSKKIFLIHHITDTNFVSPNRIELSSFIAERIKADTKRFEYFQIKNEFNKEKVDELSIKLKEKKII